MPQEFEFFEDEEAKPPRRSNSLMWNILTLLVLLAALLLGGLFLLLFINPYQPFNPFPPPTLPPTLGFPTPTATLPFATLPPTWTPSPGPSPLASATPWSSPTPPSTATPQASATPSPIPSTPTLSPTPALSPTPMPYALQSGTPSYLSSQIWHPDLGCNYLGVVGQLLDVDGRPLVGVPVAIKVSGTLDGASVIQFAIPGTAEYVGPAGFDIQLADHPIASSGALSIQVIDLNNQFPLSPAVPFDTRDSCDQNVVLINFQRQP